MVNWFVDMRFLSTPSGWRATDDALPCLFPISRISIHALRVEGDTHPADVVVQKIISIHALRVEGDQGRISWWAACGISIHALRVEGDALSISPPASASKFLSTPSGWRATRP